MLSSGVNRCGRIERSAGASTSAPCAQRPAGAQRRVRAQATPELVDALSLLAPHLDIAAMQIAAPCQVMKCGDIVYRSTLDPALYKNGGFDWRTVALLLPLLGYLVLPPGVLSGAIDYYLLAPIRRKQSKAIDKNDIILGKRLGTGGFGTVFKGELKEAGGVKTPIIVKKAKEFGEAEVWMNERMSRVGGNHVAEFVTAFDDATAVAPGPGGGGRPAGAPLPNVGPLDANAIWLVWVYEGDNTLMSLMEKREWPYNLEPLLFGRELRAPRGPVREAVTLKEAARQLLAAVAACHSVGIVHRDIKPANCIVSSRDRKLKLIDLGAAADLRIGINYVPNEYLLDPRYAPPQQYIMSTQTPRPPPKPVAAFLSPILWAMERPDRFDMYSVGITLLQMAFSHLRNDNALIAFNARLRELRWDLLAWRAEERQRLANNLAKPAMAESLVAGLAVLDADGEAGWDLLAGLLAYKPTDRLSASEALAHRWLAGGSPSAAASSSLTGSLGSTVSTAAAATTAAFSSAGKTINRVAGPGFADMAEAMTNSQKGALTEAQLMEELGLKDAAPVAPREGSQTIAWWQERQSDVRQRITERREKQVGGAASNARGPSDAAAVAAAAAAAAASNGGGPKFKVPFMLGGKKAAPAVVANGNGNGKAAAAKANANGKAAAAKANGNGKAAANGNGRAAANGNGRGAASGSDSEGEDADEAVQSVKDKVLGMFRR